jgi:hypothetical protein
MKVLLAIISSVLLVQSVTAQSPTPIVVQAAPASPAVPTGSAASAQVVQDSQSIEAAIRLLEQLKAANDEILGKQKAALERLDEMQQAADQLKAFAARA